MTRPYEIADYREEDQERFLAFFSQVFTEIGFVFDAHSKDSDVMSIPKIYQAGCGVFWLAKSDGEIVGSIALRELGDGLLELKRYYVLTDHRGQGLGAQLLDKAIHHAIATTCKGIRLDTTSQYDRAIAIFKSRGFREISKYNDNPDAEIYMQLEL